MRTCAACRDRCRTRRRDRIGARSAPPGGPGLLHRPPGLLGLATLPCLRCLTGQLCQAGLQLCLLSLLDGLLLRLKGLLLRLQGLLLPSIRLWARLSWHHVTVPLCTRPCGDRQSCAASERREVLTASRSR